MLGLGLPSLDFSSLLQLVLSALALVCGTLLLVRKAASRYFVVDASFEPREDYEYRHRMSIGTAGGDGDRKPSGDGDGDCKPSAGGPVSGSCAVCRSPATKKCSRCKSLRYCSQACQTTHWENHKLNCKPGLSDKVDIVTSSNDACRRRKSLGFSSISLVPARGTCKVLQEPKKILFPYDEFVKLFNWDKPGFPPCGLLNCGNSCFANVVLQCLACTRPLIAYLLERDHHRGCIRKHEDWCFLCELQVHIQRASESLHPFSPIKILSRLPNIGGNLGYGRQEDAHEFMRFAIDTMQSVCLDEFGGEKALDPSTQETTLIHHIFGGYLQSQVICTKCNMISNRYENMMDLTVEIQGDAESLEECLDQFTMKEWLDGENMYKCDGCNDYVRAWKRLTIHQAPNILTIALKRFQSGRFGKLNKRVTFPENLDLTPYMSGNGDVTDLYSLYAVVVHVDMLNASFFGHYICYTKDYHGRWYRIDDCKVMNVEVEDVLSQGAYMLFYSRRNARREPYIKPTEPARKKQLVADPESSNVSMPRKPISVNCLPSNAGLQSSLLPCEVPIDLSLPGHDRDLSVKSNTMEEVELEDMGLDIPSEIKPIHVPKGLSDVAMDDFEPSSLGPKDLEEGKSSSSWALEDVSSAKPVRSNSISPVENPPIEVQMIDIKPMFEPKGLGEMDIDYAEPSWLEPKDVEAGKSGTSRWPADTSSVSPAEISSIAVEVIEVKPKPIPKDSGDVNLNNSELSSLGPSDLREAKSTISPHVQENVSFVKPMQFNSISPGEISSIEVQHTDCREPFVSSDADICMEEDSRSISIGEESFKLSKYPPEETFTSERNVHIIAETSYGASITMPSPMPETSYDSGPNLEQVVAACSQSDSANQIKGLEAVSSASGGTRVPPCWENGSGGNSKPLFSRGFLDRPARKEFVCHKEATHTGNCGVALAPDVNGLSNGHSEPDLLGQSVSDNETSLESLSSNGNDNLPGSSEKFISSKYCKQPTIEGKIASADSVKTDNHPCKSANSDGSAELEFAKQSVGDIEASLESLSTNGQDTNLPRRSDMSFVSRGFLNKPYRNFKNDDDKIPKKKLGTDANGKDALPETAVSSLSRGFLNKNEDRIAKKELEIITDPPCKTKTSHSNGVAEWASVYQDDGKKYRPVRESNGQGPPGAAFANENGSRRGHNKGAGPTSASDVGSTAGSIQQSKTVPGMWCPSDGQQQT